MVKNSSKPALIIHKPKSHFRSFIDKTIGKSAGDKIFNIINYIIFFILFLICLYPFFYVLKTSLEVHEIVDGQKSITKLSFDSYVTIFANAGLLNSFLLSIGVTLLFAALSVLLTVLSAYPLTRRNLKGRKFFLSLLIFTMLFSGGLIPYYILIKDLGLRNNWMVYILVGLLSPFNVIIVRNFITGIPEDIFESAKMDGASETRVLFQIVFPLSGPIIATIALWTGVSKWNDWYTGILYVTDKNLWMIQQFLRNILITSSAGQSVQDPSIMTMAESVKMAAVVISIIPIMVVYPFVEKYFVKGTLLGSVKG